MHLATTTADEDSMLANAPLSPAVPSLDAPQQTTDVPTGALSTAAVVRAMITAGKGISDLLFSPGRPPQVERHGNLVPVTIPGLAVLTADDTARIARDLLAGNALARSTLADQGACDLSYALEHEARFRVNIFRQRGTYAIVMRVIATAIPTLDTLGLPATLAEVATLKSGIVLVTGPTGSGKSTTLAAMVDYINENKPDHILTIEDPIEFVHESKKSLINQREVHRDTLGFNEALRSALREDPDVILVGELRDLETIRLALTAAETGHLVFGTLHTSSAAKTIDRVVDVFPAAEKEMVRAMLSESLRAVISQTLLKKVGGGRIAAHEIMIGTPAIRNLIREGKIAQMYSAIQTGQGSGMQTLDQNLAELLTKGLINKEEARFRAVNKENF
jgi:twitching motility protein PilT